MKKFTFFVLALFVFTAGFAQKRESGIKLEPDTKILNVAGNEQYLTKTPARVYGTNAKSVFYSEGFETVTVEGALPEGWVQKRTTALNDEPTVDAVSPMWFRNSADYGFDTWQEYVYAGVASMATGYTAPDFTWAISPEIVIGETEGDVKFKYWVWTSNHATNPWLTNYYVKVKSEGVWYTVLSYLGQAGESNAFETPVVINMNPFKGKTVQIAYVYEYTDGYQMAVDDIFIGEELTDDFGISGFSAYPYFGLLANDEVKISADVFCGGLNSGTVEVSLLVNGAVDETFTTGTLTLGGEAEFVEFTWVAPAAGDYELSIALPEDQFALNNSSVENIYINHYFNIAEDFENFEFDELGIPTLVWPPVGWSVSDALWVDATTQWPIYDAVAAMISARGGEDANASGETALYSGAVVKTSQDKWMKFYLSGVNNNVYLDPATYPTAVPQGQQGYSTFQLRYAESIEGPWTDLGDPIEFLDNTKRLVEVDLTSLVDGTYYFAFTTTSTFVLTIGENLYKSFVMVDNVMISENPQVSTKPLNSIALNLYPNPTRNTVNINSDSQINSVSVYNVLGSIVLQKQVNSNSDVLNVSSLNGGLYIVRIATQNGEVVRKLQIK